MIYIIKVCVCVYIYKIDNNGCTCLCRHCWSLCLQPLQVSLCIFLLINIQSHNGHLHDGSSENIFFCFQCHFMNTLQCFRPLCSRLPCSWVSLPTLSSLKETSASSEPGNFLFLIRSRPRSVTFIMVTECKNYCFNPFTPESMWNDVLTLRQKLSLEKHSSFQPIK